MTLEKDNEPIPLMSDLWLLKKLKDGVNTNEVLTTITDIDMYVDMLQDRIDRLTDQRKSLMNRAIAENIQEDTNAILIKIPGKQVRNQIEDIEKFRKEFREGYHLIRDQQRRDIEEAYHKDIDHLQVSAIPLMLADKKVGKLAVTDFVGYKPQEIKIVVQRKHGSSLELHK